MKNSDRKSFAEMLSVTLEIHGKTLNTGVLTLWWQLLEGYDFGQVKAAFAGYLGDSSAGRYPATPAAIIAKITESDGRPCADEAWSIALESFDEAATVCTTPEIMEAVAVAMRVYDSGDRIGARVAFRAAYDRITARARKHGVTPSWQLSLGHDENQRYAVAQRAVEVGRIPPERAQALLPAPEPEGPIAAIAGLLTGKTVDDYEGRDAIARQHFKELRRVISRHEPQPGPSKAEIRKADIKSRKVQVHEKLKAMQGVM